jgi:hypothetical protein
MSDSSYTLNLLIRKDFCVVDWYGLLLRFLASECITLTELDFVILSIAVFNILMFHINSTDTESDG